MSAPYDYEFEPDPRASPYGWAASRVKPRSRVLDLGCGNGAVLAHLEKEKQCEVLGVDLAPHERLRIDPGRFRAHDLERDRDRVAELAAGFDPDHVLLLDVLEHLVEPERLLAALAKRLAPRTRLLVSLPNIASASVLLRLLVDAFPYQDSGLLDRTHLRFFTEASAKEAFRRAELEVLSVSRIERSLAIQEWTAPLAAPDGETVERWSRQLNPGSRSYQVLLEARPRASAPALPVRELEDGLLSVVVRFHDPERLGFLDEALFSLAVQSFTEIEPVVVVQNATPSLLARVEELLASQPWPGAPRARVVPVAVPEGKDGRSALLNRGIEESRGRFLAFLDDDDVVYQGGYATLVRQLLSRGRAIALGGCRRAVLRREGDGWYVEEKGDFIPAADAVAKLGRVELFKTNFVPIHSYVLDRSRLGAFPLRFDESLSRLEDYELLLRLAASFELDMERLDTPTAEYRIRRDGSNTVIVPGYGTPDAKNAASWDEARRKIAALRKELVCLLPVSELVLPEPLQAEIAALRRRSTEFGAIEGKLSFRALMAVIRTLDGFPRLKAALRALIVFPGKLVARLRSKEP